jgi:ubiquinone biosynthesis protein COQ9
VSEKATAARLEEVRDRILLATLPHVAVEGWSDRAVREGLADTGSTGKEALLVFAGGPLDMIEHWMCYADRRMLELLRGVDPVSTRVRERIASAVRLRIEVNAPYREAVRRTISYLALPPNALAAARSMYATVDAIWYACGDSSTDLSFYTKRATLAAVYGTSLLYWLDDSSEEFVDTWAFLDRRIDDVMRVPKLKGRMRQAVNEMTRFPIRPGSFGRG